MTLDELEAELEALVAARRPIRLRVPLERSVVEIVGNLVPPGRHAHEWRLDWRARAPYLLPVGPRITVEREGTLRMWLKRFGYQDVEVGDPAFDFDYTVKSDRPEDAVRCLAPVATRVRPLGADGLRSERDGVELRGEIHLAGFAVDGVIAALVSLVRPILRSAEEHNRELIKGKLGRVRRAAVVIAEIASTDLYALAALLALPGATVSWPDLPVAAVGPPIVTVERRQPIALTVGVERGVARTIARAVDQRGGGRFEERLAGPDGLAGARLRGDGNAITLAWSGVADDPMVLEAGVALLEARAAPIGAGPYR